MKACVSNTKDINKVNRTISYAQNREDMIIEAFFEDVKRGFYVDIGANHPTYHSVTKIFYDKGWRGINVEPNSRLINLLEQQRPRDVNLQLGIADKEGRLTIREYEGWYSGLSTFSKEMQLENKDVAEYRDVEVDITTLEKLFEQNKVDKIQFMKVDVEGYEYNVLVGNNWSKYRPELLCIEANHAFKDWHSLVEKVGYKKVFFDGLNEYYLSSESMHRVNKFSYVKSIIGKSIISPENEDLILSLEHKVNMQQGEINSYKSDILQLNRDIIELKRVVPLLKQLFKSLDGFARRKIERLNKRKNSEPLQFHIKPEVAKKTNELLRQIRMYDTEAYYKNSVKKDKVLYTVTSKLYDAFSKLTFAFGKKLLGIVRRLKR